jgi:hypothetical protein
MKTKILILFLVFGIAFLSCEKEIFKSDGTVELSGTLAKQGITTYMYGSHVMSGYALKSNTIDLDDYLNKSITIVGKKIEGYPVDGGPDYLEVIKVKE